MSEYYDHDLFVRNYKEVMVERHIEDALECDDIEGLISMLECGYIDDLDVTEAMGRLGWTHDQQVSLILMMEALNG